MVRARLAFANVMTACEWLDQHKDARGSTTARIIVDRQIGRSARSTLCLLWDNRWSELSSAWLHECLSFETTMLNKPHFPAVRPHIFINLSAIFHTADFVLFFQPI